MSCCYYVDAFAAADTRCFTYGSLSIVCTMSALLRYYAITLLSYTLRASVTIITLRHVTRDAVYAVLRGALLFTVLYYEFVARAY